MPCGRVCNARIYSTGTTSGFNLSQISFRRKFYNRWKFIFSSRDLTTKVKLRSSRHRKCFSSRYSRSVEIDVLILIWEFSPSKHHRVAVEDVARASKAFLRYLLNVENSNELMMKIDFWSLFSFAFRPPSHLRFVSRDVDKFVLFAVRRLNSPMLMSQCRIFHFERSPPGKR